MTEITSSGTPRNDIRWSFFAKAKTFYVASIVGISFKIQRMNNKLSGYPSSRVDNLCCE